MQYFMILIQMTDLWIYLPTPHYFRKKMQNVLVSRRLVMSKRESLTFVLLY